MAKESSPKEKPAKPRNIGILVDAEYEDLEVWYPYYRFLESGHNVTVVGSGAKPTFHSKNGYPIKADRNIENVSPKDFDALIIPGGWAPYKLRVLDPVLELVRSMDAGARCVAAITQGGWVLASAGVLRGRAATANRALRDDMKNAGCKWTEDDVVVDKNLVTARRTRDLPAFSKAIHVVLGAVPAE